MRLVLRIVLTLLVVAVAAKVGITFAPRRGLSGPATGPRSVPSSRGLPDWGGGRFVSAEAGQGQGTLSEVRGECGPGPGDYSLTLTLPDSGGTRLFVLPSSRHFRKELLPGAGDAEAPAPDIPMYPLSSCRMQVGHGTDCFIGFYLTPDSVEAVREFYLRALARLGWERVGESRLSNGDCRTAERPGPVETFVKRDMDRTVMVQLREQDSAMTRIGLVAQGAAAGGERK